MDYDLKGDSPSPVDLGVVHTVGLREQEHVAVGEGVLFADSEELLVRDHGGVVQ